MPAFKEIWTEYKLINSQALQATLKRVDFAFERWFKGLGKRPRYKSIRHYSGWTYPAKSGYSVESNGENGYITLAKIGSIQMRGKAKYWVTPTTCTIVYRNGKWYASITIDVLDQVLKPDVLPINAVGFGMLRSTIKYKVEQIGGVFVEVPTKKVKPSQTCPKCGHQHKKTLDIRVHNCESCGYVQDRDIAAAEVMLYYAQGNLPGFGTNLVRVGVASRSEASRREDADVTSSTSRTRSSAGSMKQLGQMKRQKLNSTGVNVETHPSTFA
ncbi:transposase [Anabaena azotica]|nr:transposase [Anabaena azotica]